jgi:DNA modification methylase
MGEMGRHVERANLVNVCGVSPGVGHDLVDQSAILGVTRKVIVSLMPKQKPRTNSKVHRPTTDLFGRLASESEPTAIAENGDAARRGSGPPNRMNDLPYREWMKFQKSFFRFREWQVFVDQSVLFFTKNSWPDGTVSKTLLLGFQPPAQELIGSRLILSSDVTGLEAIATDLRRRCQEQQKFDFILVNLLPENPLSDRRQQYSTIFQSLRTLLTASKYCGVVTEWDSNSFPAPWALATNGREFLKLRDEKIGLNGAFEPAFYCLFFQAEDESAATEQWDPDKTQIADSVRGRFPTWVMPKSPPRKADEINHPAKFPESLVTGFIEAFTKRGDTVLDPMMGTGSTLIAALRCARNAVGIDLNPRFVAVAQDRVRGETLSLLEGTSKVELIQGDARNVAGLVGNRMFDYCVTSPPYWSMLTNEGSENQKARRDRNLPTVYSDSGTDLGNIEDYQAFLKILIEVYDCVGEKLKKGGHLTVVVKNIKRNHTIYPLAWDLVRQLAKKDSKFAFAGTTLWCQDDVGLKPFAVGIYWVSNTLHTYCLHFRKC